MDLLGQGHQGPDQGTEEGGLGWLSALGELTALSELTVLGDAPVCPCSRQALAFCC